MASRQQEFVNRAYNDARAAGLPDAQARLAASQAALETNYGKSVVGNNYFGIKAGSGWAGPSVTANTWEDYGNAPVREQASFRSYENPASSFRDWASTVGRRWGGALTAPTLTEAVENLNYGKPGGYATDRSYGSKIRSIDRRYGPSSMADTFDAPTPTSRPPDLESILSSDTSAPVSNSLLNNYSAPVTTVQRAAMQEPSTVANFDNSRFGPAASQVVPELSYGRFATTPFDAERFGVGVPATTTNQLRRSLLDQQLEAGVLPSLDNPAYAAMSQPSVAMPATLADASVQAPSRQMSMPQNSLLSAPEQRAVAAQRAYLESQPYNKQSPQIGRTLGKGLGTVGGALLGGLALGPLGAVLGGLTGRAVTNSLLGAPGILTPAENEFPDRPKNQSRGEGSLTDYGRSVANSSGQFRSALSSGGKGLY